MPRRLCWLFPATLKSFISILQVILLTGLSVPAHAGSSTNSPPRTAIIQRSFWAPVLAKARMSLYQFEARAELGLRSAGSRLNPPTEFDRLKSQFAEPLIPTGQSSPANDAELLTTLLVFRSRTRLDDLSALKHFVEKHPSNCWNISILVNIGLLDYHYGYFVPVLDLPADPPAPETPALEVLNAVSGTTPAADGPTFLSQLLFYSAAISASKRVPSTGDRYALRVNPSSGNLHPTEFHFLTRGLKEWPDGLYHYRPSAHMAEQRALGDLEMKWTDSSVPVIFVLTSIAWREAWKYRDRAYRYCLHDMGHAWQALALAARAIGCDSFAVGQFPDDEIAQSCRLHEDEWPMLIVQLCGRSIPVREPYAAETVWYDGQANQLSTEVVVHPRIDGIHSATKLSNHTRCGISAAEPASNGSGEIKLPRPASSRRPFGEVARMRRSALDFMGGMQSISFAQLSAILTVATRPFSADFAGAHFIQLYLYAHRVDGLQPGVYRLWQRPAELEQIKSGDQRVLAAGLSLGQDLAGNACVAFSMIGDFERAVRAYGDRGYRYVHFEAGAIGHRLYLAAETLGLGATGIGAFYDDEVHDYLNLPPEQGQVVYHFAIGYPVPDPRLET